MSWLVKFAQLTFELKMPASQPPFGPEFVKGQAWHLTLWYSRGFSGVCHLQGWEGGRDRPLPLCSRPIPASKTVLSTDLSLLDVDCSWPPVWQRGDISPGDVSAGRACLQRVTGVSGAQPTSQHSDKEGQGAQQRLESIKGYDLGKALLASPFLIWTLYLLIF